MFGNDFMRNFSPLQTLIARAVEPYRREPDYATHLEVAEFINKKKANTAREAAMTIVRIVNNRNPQVSLHALALLDTLVQQCGYAFQLQVATKEFLNELVRRFPERPPPMAGPVMLRILELIHTWRETICVDSRFKEDFGNIRDMHRLLTLKGYRFRDFPHPQQNNVASTSNLKSAEELEEEDREAQSAKLQELIRRGTPRDLAAAQELMKSLAGAEPEKKPDYRTQSLTELNKLEQKVILLNEMLDNVDTTRGERFASGDAYDQVSGILSAARPKIQKWISDAESGDPEMLDTFLQINDQLNSVLNRNEAFKRGDYTAAANPIPEELASTSRTQDTSLIDFDEATPTSGAPASTVDELADLFGPSSTTTAQITQKNPLSIQQPTPTSHGAQQQSSFAGSGPANHLASLFNTSPTSTPGGTQPVGAISLSWTPTPQQQTSNLSSPQPQGTFWNMQSGSGGVTSASGMMGNALMQPQQQQRPVASAAGSTNTAAGGGTPAKDPFADLAGLF